MNRIEVRSKVRVLVSMDIGYLDSGLAGESALTVHETATKKATEALARLCKEHDELTLVGTPIVEFVTTLVNK